MILVGRSVRGLLLARRYYGLPQADRGRLKIVRHIACRAGSLNVQRSARILRRLKTVSDAACECGRSAACRLSGLGSEV
jgi:hypothetical protein